MTRDLFPINELRAALDAACPRDLIVSISVGNPGDKHTWRIDFAPQATKAQRDAAQAALDAFDPATPPQPPRDLAAELDALAQKLARTEKLEAALIEKDIVTKVEIDAKVRTK